MTRFSYLGHEQVLDALIRNGANIKAALKDGRTPLYASAFNGNSKNLEQNLREK